MSGALLKHNEMQTTRCSELESSVRVYERELVRLYEREPVRVYEGCYERESQ